MDDEPTTAALGSSTIAIIFTGVLLAASLSAVAIHGEQGLPRVATGEPGQEFGSAVALQDGTALVGAPGATVDGQEEQGVVRVYTMSEAGWQEQATLTAPGGQEGDRFGTSVDLDQGTAIVGARHATVDGNASQGAAYVLRAEDGDWAAAEATQLTHADGTGGDLFGTSVALHNGTAVVGAPSVRADGNLGQGAAYVFSPNRGSWSNADQVQLIAQDGNRFDAFGSAVAIHEDTIVVGAPEANVDGNDEQGAAYVFTPDEVGWASTDQTPLTTDGAVDDRFGSAVALDEDTLVVGAERTDVGDNVAQGTGHVFVRTGGTWAEQVQLVAPEAGTDDRFGSSVALHGDTLLVGAHQVEVDGSNEQGAAYLYEQEEGAWTIGTLVTGEHGASFDRFGSAVALDEDHVLVGAPGTRIDGEPVGAAHLGALHLDGAPPTITIDQVGQEGQPMVPGNPIEITVTAEAGTSALASVEVAVDGEQVANEDVQDPGPAFPMGAEWVPEQPGTYEITATVTDEAGATGTDSLTVEIGTGEQPELAVLDEVFPPVTISEPADGDTFAAGEEVAFSGTLRTGSHHGFVIVDLPGGQGLLATPSGVDEVAFPGGTAGPFDTVTIKTDDGEVSIPENGDIFEEIRFPGDTWIEVEFPGDTSAEPMPGSDWEEIRFPGDSFQSIAFPGDSFETVTVETQDGEVSFPGDSFTEIQFPGDSFHRVSFPGDSFEEIRFPGDTFSSVSSPGDTFGTVTVETESGEVSFPGDTFSEIVFPGDSFDQVKFPGDTFEEIRFPGDTFSSVSFPGDTFGTVTVETESGEVSFPGETFSEIVFPGDSFDQMKFPGDTFEEIRFPGDTFSSVSFPGDTFQTVTIGNDAGTASFPGDTFAELQFPGDTFDQVNFPGDTFSEISFQSDALAEARFSEGAINTMTLSTSQGPQTFPGGMWDQRVIPGDTWDELTFSGDALDEIQLDADTLRADWSAAWTPDEPGTHEAAAVVFDAEGEPASQTVTFTVQEGQGSAPAPGIGALAAVLVIGAGALVLRRW